MKQEGHSGIQSNVGEKIHKLVTLASCGNATIQVCQRPPTFFAPGTGFMVDKFFHGPERVGGNDLGMIQIYAFTMHFISISITL